jgi:hypothetical protein
MKLLEGQSLTLPVVSALLLLWLLYRTILFFRFHHKYNFPNLVPGVPLFGNMLQIPTDTAERRLYLHKLAKKYGEMYVSKVTEKPALTTHLVQVHAQGGLQLLGVHELSACCK